MQTTIAQNYLIFSGLQELKNYYQRFLLKSFLLAVIVHLLLLSAYYSTIFFQNSVNDKLKQNNQRFIDVKLADIEPPPSVDEEIPPPKTEEIFLPPPKDLSALIPEPV